MFQDISLPMTSQLQGKSREKLRENTGEEKKHILLIHRNYYDSICFNNPPQELFPQTRKYKF